MIRGSLVVAAIALPLAPAAAQRPAMNKAEVAQLYTAAGFPIVADQPTNSCGRPAQPGTTFVDLNGDGRAEALMVDANPACYGGEGRYFAVVTKDAAGKWRSVIRGAGLIQSQRTATGGWFDMKVTDRGCARPYRYDGTRYMPAGPCAGAVAAAPKPAPGTKSAPMAKPAAPSIPPPAAGTAFAAAEQAAIFRAAGAERIGNHWSLCKEDERKTPATIENKGDLNGDGRPEAVVLQEGTYCYGMTGAGFQLVSKGTEASGGRSTAPKARASPNFCRPRGSAAGRTSKSAGRGSASRSGGSTGANIISIARRNIRRAPARGADRAVHSDDRLG